jgi:hypothetical protein
MITKILTAVWTAVLVSTSVSTGTPIHALPYNQRDDWAHETPESVIVDPWADAVTLTGYATTYDAYEKARSWYDDSNTWVYTSSAACTKIAGCFWHDGSLVRPWSSTLNNLYAALGPVLRKVIADQMPRWHTIPTHTLRITSLESGRSVEVWIADYCACTGYAVVDNKKIHPLVDLSPETWEALGRVYNGQGGVMHADGRQWHTNWITVEYLP